MNKLLYAAIKTKNKKKINNILNSEMTLEKEVIEELKKDPLFIKYIEKPTYEMQLICTNLNIDSLEFINNPFYEIVNKCYQRSPMKTLKKIKKKKLDFINDIIVNNIDIHPLGIKFLKNPEITIFEKAIRNNPRVVKYFKKFDLLDQEFCVPIAYYGTSSTNYAGFISSEKNRLYKLAIRIDPNIIVSIPEKSVELVTYAFNLNFASVTNINEKYFSYEVKKEIIKRGLFIYFEDFDFDPELFKLINTAPVRFSSGFYPSFDTASYLIFINKNIKKGILNEINDEVFETLKEFIRRGNIEYKKDENFLKSKRYKKMVMEEKL